MFDFAVIFAVGESGSDQELASFERDFVLIFRELHRLFQAARAVCLGLACSLAMSAFAQAQTNTLTFTFSDDGSTVTIAASGSLDLSAGFNFVLDATIAVCRRIPI